MFAPSAFRPTGRAASLAFLLSFIPAAALGDPPPGYYDGVDSLSQSSLRSTFTA